MFALLFALCSTAMGQSKDSHKGSSPKRVKYPTQGVRFVICTATRDRLPTPLFTKVDNDYVPIIISSRSPSPRIAPSDGKVRFYETAPDVKESSKGSKAEPKDTPYMEISIPKEHRTKSLCVVMPGPDKKPSKVFFLKESDFSKGGAYVINFTNTPMEMVISPTGELDGEEKVARIAAGSGIKSVSKGDSNVWSYVTKKSNQRMNFTLSALQANSEPIRIKSSVFMTNPKITQLSFVVENTERRGVYQFLSIQYADVILGDEVDSEPSPIIQ